MFRDLDHMLNVLPVLEEIDKSFLGQFNKYDPLLNQQTTLFMQMGIENPELMKAGFKAFHQIMGQFMVDMDDVINQFLSGRIDFNKAVNNFKDFTGKHYKGMFRAGAQAVGNEFYEQLGLDKRSRAFINKARRAEMKFFKDFLTDIKNPYHYPKHPYLKRATYYAKSAKAQFFNGMVAGTGDQVDIFWKLGVPETEHCDVCPQYAGHGAYTWQTLPTVPRGGDTPCLFNCYCHLEMRPKTGKIKGGDPETMLHHGLRTGYPHPSGRKGNGQIVDKKGRLIDAPEELQNHHDDLRGRLNHARQMIEATSGAERLKWIGIRKELNNMLINLQGTYPEMRFLPTMAVKDLVSTVQSAMSKGGTLVDNLDDLVNGDEVIWVRGTSSGPGVIFRDKQGRLGVKFADGSEVLVDVLTDIQFLMGGEGFHLKMAQNAVKAFNPKASPQQLAEIMSKVDDWLTFASTAGQSTLNWMSQQLGFQVTPEYIKNFIAKQRMLVAQAEVTKNKYFIDGQYTQARMATHQQIIDDFLASGTTGNEMLMTGGYSGSGKSSILNTFFKDWENKYVMLNSDDIKLALAKADGLAELGTLAGAYHAEATDILKKLIKQAMVSGKNLMYDGTMRSFDKQLDWLKMFQDAGYTVTGLYTELPMELCQQRALGRALIGMDKRFVDPFLIQAQENLCLETFKKLAEFFDDWFHYNNNVNWGDDPILVNQKY